MEYICANNFKMGTSKKPVAKLIGTDGNIFSLISNCRGPLKAYPTAFNEMRDRVVICNSYEEALQIIMEYVDVE